MSKVMNKDEELQLCIQRFVSDTQSMINQFSEMFITEVRRFADVCMEFSIAYRGMHEEREFLSVENQSLKDELDARTSEVEILGKELRETRDENEELSRRLDCLAVNSDGQMGTVLIDSNSNRHYAVVNSMPAFPRRYSVAASIASYDDDGGGSAGAGSTSGYREQSIEFSSPSPDTRSKPTSTTSNHRLLTPPTGFNTVTNNFGQRTNLGDDIIVERKSLSKDDITMYSHLMTQLRNSASDLEQSTTVNNRTPSFDEFIAGTSQNNNNGTMEAKLPVDTGNLSGQIGALTPAVSSSAGTFYDCVGSSNFDMNMDSSNNPQLITVSDQIKRLFTFTSSMYPEGDSKSESKVTTPTVVVNDDQTKTDMSVAEEYDALKKCFEKQLEQSVNHKCDTIGMESSNSCFISKTPSPNSCNFTQHFNTYRSNPCNSTSDSNLFQNYDDDDDDDDNAEDNILRHLPPVQRINSKKIQRKRHNKRKCEMKDTLKVKPDSFDFFQDEVIDCNNLLSQSKWYQISESSNDCNIDQALESKIPPPQIELTKYLLVEVCHFISPSHFYLIVNDEKVGSNAFENFLDYFQNFYKSIEDYDSLVDDGNWQQTNGVEHNDSREWKMFYSSPPLLQQVTPGSYWACYIDDELDWRRVQVIRHQPKPVNEDEDDDEVMVRDVDSGYSSTVLVTMLRPLTEEITSVPAFAIRSSLAFIHPRSRDDIIVEPSRSFDSVDELDNWSLECCLLFEKFVYDQILTAYVSQIQSEQLTDTQVAQVLLWCTTKDDEFEVFINRKFIDFNYATNVAEDDSWIVQFGDVVPVIAESGLVVTEDKTDSQTDTVELVDINGVGGDLIEEQKLEEITETKEHKKIKIKAKNKKKKIAKENINNASEPNQLLMPTLEPRIPASVVCHDIKDDDSSAHSSQCLHHDPRLSNWIVQKHSRHVTLKKSDKVCYLFRVTCFIDVNKFIGILPFGERKIDLDFIGNFLTHTENSDDTIQSPFRQFLLEMTEYYQKQSISEIRLFPEQFVFEEANNKTMVFYDIDTHLYLRGHIVGKDINSSPSESKSTKNLPLQVECEPGDSKSPKSLSVKHKTKSSGDDCVTKWIIYAIDIGRYYLVAFEHLFKLEERFSITKPFAIACKLHDCTSMTPKVRCQLRDSIENKLLGLRFIDVDFTTERFSVSLYTFDIDANGKCSAQDIMQLLE